MQIPFPESGAIFERTPDITYFNSANIGPRLQSVSRAGHEAIDRFSRPWEIRAEDWFSGPELLRAEFAKFVEVDVGQIALIPSASYGVAIAALNLPVDPGSNIVVVQEQYPSNIYAWRRKVETSSATIRMAQRSATTPLSKAVLDCIDQATSVVAIPHCHWTDGETIHLESVAVACRKHNAALVIDASQSLGVRPLDFHAIRPDFVLAVGYKWLLGAYGLGYLYSDAKWCSEGMPIEESWLTRAGSEDFSKLVDYVDDYRPGARRFDFGEFPQFISVPMSTAALQQLNAWGAATIVERLAACTQEIRMAAERNGLTILPRSRASQHMVGIPFSSQEQAIAANKRMQAEGIVASVRGQSIRISPHMHTTNKDLSRLCELLNALGP